MKKKIILSFDYELFFGDKSGTVQKTLIEPTNKILDAMEAVGFKGNFFVDWQMLKYIMLENDTRCQKDYILLKEQLKDIIRRGHRIELHIHPHWVDAKYNGDGTWDFSIFRHYSLNSFTEDDIQEMFVEGKNLLTGIAREVDTEYEIIAFRAGGWAIQPFYTLRNAFKAAGIKIDSSTMQGIKITTDYSSCDFLNMPFFIDGYYRFKDSVENPVDDGEFIEVPISSVKLPFLSRVIGKLNRTFFRPVLPLTDGTHTRTKDNPDKWEVAPRTGICTFSGLHPLDGILRLMNSKAGLICYIDHPKDFSRYTTAGIKAVAHISESILYKDLLN